MFIDLICIQIIIVVITDLTDFPSSVYKAISYFLTKGKIVTDNMYLHLVSCSLCQMHWVGLFYLIINGSFSIPAYLLILILSFLTTSTKDILLYIKDLMSYLINRLYEWQERKQNLRQNLAHQNHLESTLMSSQFYHNTKRISIRRGVII